MTSTRDKVDQLEAELRRYDDYEETGETPPSHHLLPALTWAKKVSIGIWSILNFIWLCILIYFQPGFVMIKNENDQDEVSLKKLMIWWFVFALVSGIGIYIYRHR